MFQEGEYIIYRNTGVCKVAKVGIPDDFPAAAPDVLYYHLAPVRSAGIIYIPVDSKVFMRPVITREQALELIASIPTLEETPDYSKDQKALAEHYKAQLQTHDCAVLLQLIKNIHRKTEELSARGKTAGKTDIQYMKQAESLLHEEFSIVLDIPFDEVPDYIRKQLEVAM